MSNPGIIQEQGDFGLFTEMSRQDAKKFEEEQKKAEQEKKNKQHQH